MEEIITLRGVNKTFRTKNGDVAALQNVDLSVYRGEIFGVIGFSGAGKSTLVRCINALEVPDSGEVTVCGEQVTGLKQAELRKLRRKIGMIFQGFNLLQ
ncbi:MAG: ATP-binding cassette domain-containing protein, partial [Candidatus Gallimonas sp.]